MTHRNELSALLAVALLSGCVESTVEIPKTPNPVLLSKVDRIGGHVPEPTEVQVDSVSGKTALFAAASQEKNGNTTTTTTTSSKTTAGPLIKDVLEKTAGQDERTVRIQKLVAHATFLNLGTYAELEQSISVQGVVVAPPAPPAAPTTSSKTEVAHVSR